MLHPGLFFLCPDRMMCICSYIYTVEQLHKYEVLLLLLCVVCIHNSVEMGAITPALGTVNIRKVVSLLTLRVYSWGERE